jgi:hypothetical protein
VKFKGYMYRYSADGKKIVEILFNSWSKVWLLLYRYSRTNCWKLRYFGLFFAEFHTVWLKRKRCTGRNFFTPLVKWSVTALEPNFTKLVLTQQRFVNTHCTKLHENMTNGFFADNRSWTDIRTKECGYDFFTHKECPKWIIRQVRGKSRYYRAEGGRRWRIGWGIALQTGRSRDRFPMVSLEFFIHIHVTFRSHYGPGVDPASNRNEYQKYFLGVKAAGA